MSKQTRKNSWLKLLLTSIVVLAIAIGSVYWYVATEKFSDTKDRKAAYTVNAFDFIREFKQDAAAAKEKYNGKIVQVSGVVSALEPADTTMNIKIIDTLSNDYIIFAFQSQHVAEAKTVKVGDSVSIKAAYSDFVYSRILDAYSITFQRSTLSK